MTTSDPFTDVFEDLCKDILDIAAVKYQLPDESLKRLDTLLRYTVLGGKLNRGRTVESAYHVLQGTGDKEGSVFQARVLGWCVELLQACFLVLDDIMDGSVTRRGQPCWYRLESVGNDAVNDGIILEGALYILLKKHLRSHPRYVDMCDLFHEVTFKTEMGQMLDLTTAPIGKVNLDKFTVEQYNRIVLYKTAFYSFYMPVALAMLLADVKDEEAFRVAEDILLDMGNYFQIQDDFLDCFGDPAVTGKIGTDIEDNKCSWLIVQALRKSTPEQRQILKTCYGSHKPDEVAKVKALYKTLDLETLFCDFENTSYQRIHDKINAVSVLPGEVFAQFLGLIFKRKK